MQPSSKFDPKAVFLLDIDGTINPYFAESTLKISPEKLPRFDEHYLEDDYYGVARVYLQTSVLRTSIDKLKKLGVEVIWASAWNQSANLLLNAISPDESQVWKTIVFPDEINFGLSIKTWKLSTVREFIESNYNDSTAIIWADDEVFDDAQKWLDSRLGSSLLLQPERHTGLTESDWDRLLSFAETLQ